MNPDSFFTQVDHQIPKYYCHEMDDSVTLGEQFEAKVGAVILMNKFNVGPDEVEEFLKVFADTTKAATWVHFRPIAPRDCWELYIH